MFFMGSGGLRGGIMIWVWILVVEEMKKQKLLRQNWPGGRTQMEGGKKLEVLMEVIGGVGGRRAGHISEEMRNVLRIVAPRRHGNAPGISRINYQGSLNRGNQRRQYLIGYLRGFADGIRYMFGTGLGNEDEDSGDCGVSGGSICKVFAHECRTER
ncbi:hypothetical protein BDZ91DRAFT_767347 [Kalaharituber pfeilii]|nr:hypothetical protein BDZ91DRAFT_767347 [Kalaharituber pfeilii]